MIIYIAFERSNPEFEKTDFINLSGKNLAKRCDFTEETKNSSVITNGLVKKDNRDSVDFKYQQVSLVTVATLIAYYKLKLSYKQRLGLLTMLM